MSDELIKLPVRYDGTNADSQLFDADEFLVADVRGWGRLVSDYGVEEASLRQDEIGEYMADCINSHARLMDEIGRLRSALERARGAMERWRERLNWALVACDIDRDARNEIADLDVSAAISEIDGVL